MAKASTKDTPDWLPLDKALKRVVEIEESGDLARHKLVKALVAGEVRGRAGCLIVGRIKTHELLDQELPGHAWDWPTKIDFTENQSTRTGTDREAADRPQVIAFRAFRLAVDRKELRRRWPKPQKAGTELSRPGRPSPAQLILAKAEGRLRSKDTLPSYKNFRVQLSDWLGSAHPEARSMSQKTVGDHLRKSEIIRELAPKRGWWRRS